MRGLHKTEEKLAGRYIVGVRAEEADWNPQILEHFKRTV